MLPPLIGRPIRVEIRRSLGPHAAAASIPRRLILLDSEVFQTPGEFERILIHEIFHFAWVKLPNVSRRSWEALIASELARGAKGELGWSAEFRKEKLTASDPHRRSPGWRRYCCESFCDSAAWMFADLRSHEEFTLARKFRPPRKKWFEQILSATPSVPV